MRYNVRSLSEGPRRTECGWWPGSKFGALSIEPFEGSRFRSRRALWDFNRDWLGSCWKEGRSRREPQINVHRSKPLNLAHDSPHPNSRQIILQHSCQESPMAVSWGTRKRPPQSGLVLTAYPCLGWVPHPLRQGAGCRLYVRATSKPGRFLMALGKAVFQAESCEA